jgi:toxin YhaV
MHYF